MEKESGKKGFWGFLSEKYLLLSVAAAAVGMAVSGAQGAGAYALWEALPAAVLICATLWLNLRLKKRGVYYSGRRDTRKSADPRVMGTVGDISGIGCTAAAFMGIGVLFSEMYMKDGGIFGQDDFMPLLFAAAAKAVQLTACVGIITSREWSEATLCSCAARSLKIAGGECYKKVGRIGNYPGIMERAGSIFAVRLAVGIGFAAIELICAVSGGGLPYGSVWAAILAMLTLVITEAACVTDNKARTEDKHRLMNKSRKNFCTLSSILFVLAAFFFLFGFPIRSVFTTYEATRDFDYHVEMTGDIEVISVPYDTQDNAALFTGFFIVSGGFVIVCCAAACAEGRDIVSGVIKGESLTAILVGVAAITAVTVVHGRLYPAAAVDGLMVMVCISMLCFFAAVNLFALLIKKNA